MRAVETEQPRFRFEVFDAALPALKALAEPQPLVRFGGVLKDHFVCLAVAGLDRVGDALPQAFANRDPIDQGVERLLEINIE